VALVTWQATEASTLVALTKGACHVVLCGDHKQLPPTVLSRVTGYDASLSLFARLVREGVPPLMLDTQYRMHPSLAALPSDLFYAGALADGVPASARPPAPGFAWPRADMPIAMLPVESSGEVSRGTSYVNEGEVAAACHVALGFLHAGVLPREIGLISPYAAQVSMLRARPELFATTDRPRDPESRAAALPTSRVRPSV
jgi:regulator of nonsense transcripts 1